MKHKNIIAFAFILFLINIISAAQPTVVIPAAKDGIFIEHPFIETIKSNTDYKFHFHIFNSTTGLPYLNSSLITCIFHLYNPHGSHVLKVNKVSSDDIYDWEQLAAGGNFTELGQYAFVFQCNSSYVGGIYENSFFVTPTGLSQTPAQGLGSMSFIMIMLGLTVLIGYLGFRLSESKMLWVLGTFFIFLSLLFVVYDVFLGYQYYLNYTGESDGGMPEVIFYIFMLILTSGLMTSLVLLFLKWKDWARYIKKELKSKDNDDEFDKDLENF